MSFKYTEYDTKLYMIVRAENLAYPFIVIIPGFGLSWRYTTCQGPMYESNLNIL